MSQHYRIFVEIPIWRKPICTIWDIPIDKRDYSMSGMSFKWCSLLVSYKVITIKCCNWCSKLD